PMEGAGSGRRRRWLLLALLVVLPLPLALFPSVRALVGMGSAEGPGVTPMPTPPAPSAPSDAGKPPAVTPSPVTPPAPDATSPSLPRQAVQVVTSDDGGPSFGTSVAIDGGVALVNGPKAIRRGPGKVSAWVYRRGPDGWRSADPLDSGDGDDASLGLNVRMSRGWV